MAKLGFSGAYRKTTAAGCLPGFGSGWASENGKPAQGGDGVEWVQKEGDGLACKTASGDYKFVVKGWKR